MFVLVIGGTPKIRSVALSFCGVFDAYMATTFPQNVSRRRMRPKVFDLPVGTDMRGLTAQVKIAPSDKQNKKPVVSTYVACGPSVTKVAWDPKAQTGRLFVVNGGALTTDAITALDTNGVEVAEIAGENKATKIKLKIKPELIKVADGSSVEQSSKTHFWFHAKAMSHFLGAFVLSSRQPAFLIVVEK